MSYLEKKKICYAKAAIVKKTKTGGRIVVSQALVKANSTNLIPKIHLKRGDTIMLVSGPQRNSQKLSSEAKKRLDVRNIWKGQTGKIVKVLPSIGKVVVEGINMVTRATKQRSVMGKTGLVKKEAPIYASRVMLYCTACKKPSRIKNKFLDNGKKTRICRHCGEAFDA